MRTSGANIGHSEFPDFLKETKDTVNYSFFDTSI